MREGWEMRNMGDITSLQGGSQPPKSTFKYEPTEGYVRFLQIRDFKRDDKKAYIPIAKKNRTCVDSDILIGRYGASVGNICTGLTGAYNVALIKATPDAEILERKYYLYYLKSDLFQKNLLKVSERSAQNGFSKKDVFNFQIPVPPLAVQRRIVARLDAAFGLLDQAQANVERSLELAGEIWESVLGKTIGALYENSELTALNKITDVKDGTHYSPKYVSKDIGIPFITQKNITKKGINLDKIKYISKQDHDNYYKRSNVSKGDVLIAMIGANRGESCLVDIEDTFSIKNVGLIKSSLDIDNDLLVHIFNSTVGKEFVKNESSGSAQGFIGLTKLRGFLFPKTTLKKQTQTAQQLTKKESLVNKLNETHRTKIEFIKTLRSSLLERAFSGDWG